MSTQRASLFLNVCAWAGATFRPINPQGGWPGLAQVAAIGGDHLVALHVSKVGRHSRAAHEYRFQNPTDNVADGQHQVVAPNGAIPILVGVAEVSATPILVVTDGSSRVGLNTRFPVLFNISIVQQAFITGWSEYVSTSGETIIAMRPAFLGAYVDALTKGVSLDTGAVTDTYYAEDVADDLDDDVERQRASTSRLVRRAAFGREVCEAYDNHCAMCGLGFALLEGAHIYPARAPGSSDKIWNGIALCRNHHRLFDLHQIWVAPDDHRIAWHPDVLTLCQTDGRARNFVENTYPTVALPPKPAHRPRTEMYEKRYELTPALYDWAA